MKKYNLLGIINSTILIAIVTAGVFYLTSKKESIAYVDNVKLFNGFNMTNDIKVIEEKKIKDKSLKLDSIYRILQKEKNQETDQAKRLIIQLNRGQQELEQIQNNYKNNLTQDVWNRLNEYIGEYAKTNNIEMILGTSGNGNVMYSENQRDITDFILEFSNSKYAGNQ